MLQLDLTHVLVVAAFLLICFRPQGWANNILCAATCWLATYTLINGLVAFAVGALVVQITSVYPRRFNQYTAFWCANIAAVLALYLPHLNESPGATHPLSQIEFSVAYLGSPFASLLWFPYRNMFDVPAVTLRNGIVGTGLLAVSVYVLFLLRKQIRASSPAALLFTAFALFAVGSAILTSWGRAQFDAFGVANANASRYTIFGAYLMYALIYAAAGSRTGEVPDWLPPLLRSAWCQATLVFAGAGFLVVAFLSYSQSRVVYEDAHNFNRLLAAAYLDDNAGDLKYVYPDTDVAKMMKATLRRLEIGPYYLYHAAERKRSVTNPAAVTE